MQIFKSKINVVQALSIALAILQGVLDVIPSQYMWILLIAINAITMYLRTFKSAKPPMVKPARPKRDSQ